MRRLGIAVFWIVALFYGYGALVHVSNILGMGGFDWIDAPTKWQVLDVAYLILDAIVFIGFFVRANVSIVAFYVAALSQIVLYTVLRPWIIDVPDAFRITPEQNQYLTLLVIFHVVTLVLVTGAIRLLRLTESDGRPPRETGTVAG